MMRKNLQRWLMTFLVVLLAGWSSWQGDEGVSQWKQQEAPTASVIAPQDDHHHEATLTDATSLYRICSSRPQRLVPSHGSKTERTYSPCGFARQQTVKPLHPLHDSRRRLETAPFSLSASCKYYVIALRHIIR